MNVNRNKPAAEKPHTDESNDLWFYFIRKSDGKRGKERHPHGMSDQDHARVPGNLYKKVVFSSQRKFYLNFLMKYRIRLMIILMTMLVARGK